MAKISKKDANPIVALLLSLILGLGHLIINGQQRKWLFILICAIVGNFLCCLPGLLITILSLLDAYKTAQRLQAGEEIDENEYSVALLYKIIHFVDKTATFKGQA